VSMRAPVYSRFADTQLILRDELAIDRTLLANERTLLAYLRSGVALFIAGITMVHFSEQGWFMLIGAACMPAGIICGIIGIIRFFKMNSSILLIRDTMPITGAPTGESQSSAASGQENAAP